MRTRGSRGGRRARIRGRNALSVGELKWRETERGKWLMYFGGGRSNNVRRGRVRIWGEFRLLFLVLNLNTNHDWI